MAKLRQIKMIKSKIRNLLKLINLGEMTVKTLKLMSKMKVMLSKCIEIVTVSDIHTRSASGKISLISSSYFE